MVDFKELDLSDPKKVEAFTQKFEELFREGVREEIEGHRAAGNPIYFGDANQEGKLIKEMPDGRRYSVKIDASGEDEILQELT